MSASKYDVIAIGNAIVDIIGRCDDAYLTKHDCLKGHMRLVDAPTITALYRGLGESTEISGGSAANTAVGIASFGGRAAFIGKIADDAFGATFTRDIVSAGVAFSAAPSTIGVPTSCSLILVTPDGERTMNTMLGISTHLGDTELIPSMIADAKILYLEGYLFDRTEAKAAFRKAVSIAKAAGREVALTLSDGFCVDRHRDEFKALIRDGVDIVFANEDEIKSLYQVSDFSTAAKSAAVDMKLGVLTRGALGSVILSNGRQISIPVAPVAHVIDSTGAGDLYAAGFLYGYSQGATLEQAGRLGSLAAAEIIIQIGARPAKALKNLTHA